MEVRCMKTVEASVGAVTSLNDEVFVALNDSRQIHVYHAEDLHFVRCLPVEGLGTQVFVTSIALLSRRGRAMLCVCQLLASIVQYVERNLILLAVLGFQIYGCEN